MSTIDYEVLVTGDTVPFDRRSEIASFLHEHLGKYRDEESDILKAIDYALGGRQGKGGFVMIACENGAIVGAVVVNKTGMEGYIPENILVYIATHEQQRGRGIGRELMQRSLRAAEGAVALHVEPDNPAKILYEKLGFTNKYLEMRYYRK
jgi:ribosomal protein S18 acetylase RimI-like enzyme